MSSSSEPPGLVTIGWKELVTFPEWGVSLHAKVDTGACSSALDVVEYELIDTPAGPTARLRLSLDGPAQRVHVVTAPVVGSTLVRNTGGVAERRLVVEALMQLGPVGKRIHLTVARRSAMRFRMLLGRSALAGSFVVDAGQEYVARK
jgi:hypothetical protein